MASNDTEPTAVEGSPPRLLVHYIVGKVRNPDPEIEELKVWQHHVPRKGEEAWLYKGEDALEEMIVTNVKWMVTDGGGQVHDDVDVAIICRPKS